MDIDAATVMHQTAENSIGTEFDETIMLLNAVFVAGFWIYQLVQNYWRKDW